MRKIFVMGGARCLYIPYMGQAVLVIALRQWKWQQINGVVEMHGKVLADPPTGTVGPLDYYSLIYTNTM